MNVENCLILAAGFGTRMGEIGRVLPKVLWPVFEKTLLELQISYARSLGCKKIYINAHYLSEKIISEIKDLNEAGKVTILLEKNILDSGGAIHNYAQMPEVSYKGNVLILNGDQFLYFSKVELEEAINKMDDHVAMLFSILVDKGSSYNETIIENGTLKSISRPTQEKNFQTYSGVGIINLEKLNPAIGPSKFFETVAPFKTDKVGMIHFPDIEYWDFGTNERYKKSHQNLLKINSKSNFFDFLLKEKAVLPNKIKGNSYGDLFFENSIILDTAFIGDCENTIIIKAAKEKTSYKNKVVYGKIEQS